MKKNMMLGLVAIAGLIAGCETRAQSGAVGGAAAGATVGGLAGGWRGAAIGGVVGAAAGGAIGYSLDESERRAMEQRSPQALRHIDNGQMLTVDDVIDMHNAGIRDETIIKQIEGTNSSFRLSTNDLKNLQNAGISQRVIDAMIDSGAR